MAQVRRVMMRAAAVIRSRPGKQSQATWSVTEVCSVEECVLIRNRGVSGVGRIRISRRNSATAVISRQPARSTSARAEPSPTPNSAAAGSSSATRNCPVYDDLTQV